MAAQTASEYFQNEENWGNYQYITLKELVDDMLADTTDEDSYLANTKRSKLVRKLKAGIRVVNNDTQKMFNVAQITLSPTLFIALPQNYVDWIRVSYVDDNDRLQPLNINRNINTADGYLQNFQYELLFDNEGNLLTTDLANAYQNPYIRYTVENTDYPHLIAKHGDFKVNDERGTMHFSSNLEGRDVVIEYLSDGLSLETIDEKEIRVHKDLQDAIRWYAIAEIISTRKNVNQYDKTSARNRYRSEKHKAMIKALKFDFLTIGREFNSMPK